MIKYICINTGESYFLKDIKIMTLHKFTGEIFTLIGSDNTERLYTREEIRKFFKTVQLTHEKK